jgi:hypothetical protein
VDNLGLALAAIAGPLLAALQRLATELQASLSDWNVWFSILAALLLGGVCLVFGTWATRRVGLLHRNAPAGETLGVGLGAGLLIVAAWWATMGSLGRSSFTPVALAFAIAIILGKAQPSSRGAISTGLAMPHLVAQRELLSANRPLIRMAVAGAAFVVLIGLLYGATMAPSPRENQQPVEFLDEAFYSVLGADLARTGTESIYSPSGFDDLPGLPSQTWYHWGELWLAAPAISLFGIDPVFARHYVVLPLILLAAAALTGTLVRRIGGTSSRAAFVFGASASVLLAPIPLPGTFFGSWARGLIFGITMYGVGVVATLLVLYTIALSRSRAPSRTLSVFSGGAIASIVPSHIVLAVLALVGVGSVIALQAAHMTITRKRLTTLPASLKGTVVTTVVILFATVLWGISTGHGIGTSGTTTTVSPFNESWREALLLTCLGAGTLLAIPFGWLVTKSKADPQAWLFAGTSILLVAGAFAWGARLGDFTMFHVFYGGIAAFATPVAAVAAVVVLRRLQRTGHRRLVATLVVLCLMQLQLGAVAGLLRLQTFGPHDYPSIPVEVLRTIARLPSNAKLAYACRPTEELAFWNPKLVSIAAHTGRPVVPMCFEAEYFGILVGTPMSPRTASPLFQWAPQRTLYPDADARPSSSAVVSFLRDHGIGYIYADSRHPNSLVPAAVPIIVVDDVQVLRVP